MIRAVAFRSQRRPLLRPIFQNRHLTSFVADPDFEKAVSKPTKLLLASNNEDAAAEKLLLNQLASTRKDIKAMMVSGGGDNFLSVLAHPSVESVVAVDMNPIQLALAQFKLAVACSDLTTQQALAFLGMKNTPNGRLEVYHTKIQPQLPQHVAEILEQDLYHELQTGILHFGVVESMNRYLHKILQDKGYNLQSLWNGTCDLESLKQDCHNGLGTAQEMIDATGMMDKLPPEAVAVVTSRLDTVLFPLCCMGIYNMVSAKRRSFVASLALLGYYNENTALPDWLQPEHRVAICQKRSHVTFVNSTILEVESNDKFDLVSPSNIYDWTENDVAAEGLSAIVEKFVSPDGGYLLFRRGFGQVRETVNDTKLRICDKVTPQDLANVDESPLFFHNNVGIAALRY